MPFWKKRTEQPAREKTPEELAAELQALPGDLPCSEVGCTARAGLPCVYVDRRLRPCHTAWCPEHRAVAGLQVYCRRHAGVINALPAHDPNKATVPYPDLENRAPSLVAWVARQLDDDIWRLMQQELDVAGGGGHLIDDPVALVFVGVDRQRAWERTWKLVTHEGEKRRVSLIVEEASDNEVGVKVGANVVQRLEPPWIIHRIRRETVPAEQDAAERVAFNEQVLAAVRSGLEHERAMAGRYRVEAGAPVFRVGGSAGGSAS